MADSSDLLSFLYTKKEAVVFVDKLHDLSNTLFQVGANPEAKMGELLTPYEKSAFVTYCTSNNIHFDSPVEFQKMVVSLKDMIHKVPTITITLAVKPTEKMLQTITEWLKTNIQRKCFLDIQYDPQLIGGAVVVANGIMKDYTVKKVFDGKFAGKQVPGT